jgi:hypothetical protein
LEDDVIFAVERILKGELNSVTQAIYTRREIRKLVSLASLYDKGYFRGGSELLFPPDHKLNMNVAIWKGGMKVDI